MSYLVRSVKLAVLFLVLTVVWTGCSGVAGGVRAYERGDHAAAVLEFRPLAEQGYRLAQYSLGLMYSAGHGVPQDYAQAAKWFRSAALQGVPQAQYELGALYARGLGVPQDFVLAHAWLNLAAAAADSDDARYYAVERDALAISMTVDQFAEAQLLARESFTKGPPYAAALAPKPAP